MAILRAKSSGGEGVPGYRGLGPDRDVIAPDQPNRLGGASTCGLFRQTSAKGREAVNRSITDVRSPPTTRARA
jgi:hypothetical protein